MISFDSFNWSQALKDKANKTCQEFKDNYGIYPDTITLSPGRINIIGEHVDYNQGPVFPIAISRYILIAAGLQDWSGELMLSIRNESDVYTDYEGNVKEELKRTKMIDWKEIHDWYHLSLIGISCVDEIYSIDWNKFNNKRLNTYVSSTLPEAVGLSSSSSVNCGFFKMMEHYVMKMQNCNINHMKNSVQVCARMEKYIGTSGGAMDQLIILTSDKDKAKFVEFHPYCNVKNVQLPPNITFVICNSMKKMVKSNTINFNTRVCECRLASMAIMVKLENADINKSTQLESLYSLKTKHNLNFINEILHVGTKLANIFKHSSYTISSFCEEFSLDNDILLSKLHHNITREVDDYYPNERLNHVINECNRVYEFLNLCLNEEIAESEKYVKLGQVINSGHESCHLLYNCSCPELNKLQKHCIKSGALGARLTGAGWGGCIIAITQKEKLDKVKENIKKYYSEGTADKNVFEAESSDRTTVYELQFFN